VDPSGKFLYATSFQEQNVSAYTVDATTGALTPVAGSPFPAGVEARGVTVDPSGRFAYVANQGVGSVSGYTIEGSTGALTPIAGSPFEAGTGSLYVAVDPSGRFAYVADSLGIFAYSIDFATGALTPIGGSPFSVGRGGAPFSLTVAPSGRFVYAANSGQNNVWGYAINDVTGELTPAPGSPFPAGCGPQAVTVQPSGKFAYASNWCSSNVSAYTIDTTTGTLTPVIGSPFQAGVGPFWVTVDLSGRFAYVVNAVDGTVSGYRIDQTSGALSPIAGSPFAAGVGPAAMTITGIVDTTPPDTTITSGPFGTIPVNNTTFTWTGADNLTPTPSLTYAYRLDPVESSFSAFGSATTKTYTGLANGAYTFYVQAQDQAGNVDPTPAARTFTVNVRQLTGLGPAEVWLGLGSAERGIRFDLSAEVRVDGTLVGSGQVNSVSAGFRTGYRFARLTSMPLALINGPANAPPGSVLSLTVLVRNACTGSSSPFGTARLWFNGKAVDSGPRHDTASRFSASIAGVIIDYFLRTGFALSTTPGTSHTSVDADVAAQCGPFVQFGAWSITLP
jgi:6-phosphogluconolactonase (cycloisomerase 2 family)